MTTCFLEVADFSAGKRIFIGLHNQRPAVEPVGGDILCKVNFNGNLLIVYEGRGNTRTVLEGIELTPYSWDFLTTGSFLSPFFSLMECHSAT